MQYFIFLSETENRRTTPRPVIGCTVNSQVHILRGEPSRFEYNLCFDNILLPFERLPTYRETVVFRQWISTAFVLRVIVSRGFNSIYYLQY